MADKETHRNRRRNIEADPVGGGTGKLEGSELEDGMRAAVGCPM